MKSTFKSSNMAKVECPEFTCCMPPFSFLHLPFRKADVGCPLNLKGHQSTVTGKTFRKDISFLGGKNSYSQKEATLPTRQGDILVTVFGRRGNVFLWWMTVWTLNKWPLASTDLLLTCSLGNTISCCFIKVTIYAIFVVFLGQA